MNETISGRQFWKHSYETCIITMNQVLPFPKRWILDSSKLKEFADDNFKFDKNGRKLF